MEYDVIVIGGGLAGLTAGSLLAKRNLKVAVFDKSYNPGGSCGIFKRKNTIFDQGSAMLYGFGEKGFNAHRFVFNVLEEPIDIIQHDLLYVVNFKGHRIPFHANVKQFTEELAKVFPKQRENIKRFYDDMLVMYEHVMVKTPSYRSADETKAIDGLKGLIKHPISYIRFLSYLNMSAKQLLERYFDDPEIFKFFDKLTSTYCYATVEEAPAVLASVMFVDNHVGGSYYPAGSTLFLPGKLEKVIEENGGEMILSTVVNEILFKEGKAIGVKCDNGLIYTAKYVIYSGTVWNLYDKLISSKVSSRKRREWAKAQVMTYPSVMIYLTVDKEVIPEDTAPLEMLVGNPDYLDESEVTAYILSIDDKNLCDEDEHTVMAIVPSFEKWDFLSEKEYQVKKVKEKERLIQVLERRFPNFSKHIRTIEVATPRTIEHYTMKNHGAVAGPKQMLGQHMFKRQHIRTEWPNLFCCGESTVLGTGTPTVTTSGISAANAVLRKYKLKEYVYDPTLENRVNLVSKPFLKSQLYADRVGEEKEVMQCAYHCRYCEHPACTRKEETDIRGIMRRVAVGNFVGALKAWDKHPANLETLERYESQCICNVDEGKGIQIRKVINYLEKTKR